MSERDELARRIFVAGDHNQPPAEALEDWKAYTAGGCKDTDTHRMADAILAAGYRKPRVIATIEELDALPTDSTVRSEQGGIWFKETSGGGQASWTEPGAQWWRWSSDIALPATVLYEPTA